MSRMQGWKRALPFPRRARYYVALKLIVLALAVWLALHFTGLI
jgi:hypothetical protein